ncbi:hypothetical protein L3X38_015470 [Prunus dulcis]|uniref:Uncharacterized protein n=1 Tax=Prunus dulcis TaxID=3755 RepID=A0AAD4Z893_PRUDU|nr:hypothetical protein L3X38_015470 [Prunus dulcis]
MEDEKIDDHVDTSSCKHPVDHQEEEEEESEEMKMEKFYSLIRNYHDARNRLRSRKLPFACNKDEEDDDDDNNNNISIKDKKRRKATMGDDDREEPSAAGGGGGGWVPSFELEDFGTEFKLVFPLPPPLPSPPPPPPPPPPSNTSNLETQDNGLGSLDLKLAL